MKKLLLLALLLLNGCATRHGMDTSAMFVDCYNKQRHETLLAQAESAISSDDILARRQLRQKFWDLQKECK